MEKIKFSIIVPVYNTENYLSECLESIVSQQYSNYEVICVNDCSTDDSEIILKEYAIKYPQITYVNNGKNEGLSYSRNKAMKIAQGDYIWFVDSDDYIRQGAFSLLADRIKENEVDVLNFNYTDVMEDRTITPYRGNKFILSTSTISGFDWFVESIDKNMPIAFMGNRIFKKDFLRGKNITFYEKIVHEDNLFCVQALIQAEKILNIPDEIYIYRKRSNSITNSIPDENKLNSYVIILNELLYFWKNMSSTKALDQALSKYLKTIWSKIRQYRLYFPEYKQLSIGKPEVQFFYDILISMEHEPIWNYINFQEDDLKYMKSFDNRIIYGAGNVATEIVQYMEYHQMKITAIAVSDVKSNVKHVSVYEVKGIDTLLEYKDDGLVIVAVVKRNQPPIKEYLEKLGFSNVFFVDIECRKRGI